MNDEKICKIEPATPVLVTGATGFTGAVLTRKLVEAGLNVSVVARPSSNRKPLADLDLNWFEGDVFDEAAMRKALANQTYVFHVAAAFREAKSSEQDYWNVHVKSTQIIAREAMRNPHFKRLVHISTFGVHGHVENPPGTEESPYAPGDGYQRTKLEAELWLRKFAQEHDLNYAIIRPAAIYGPGDRRLLKLFKMALKPVFPLLGNGKCMYHLVHVDDLTNTFIIAATHPAAQGDVFISGGTEPIPVADIAKIVASHFGKQTKIVRLPIAPFFWMADICETLCRPFKIEPPIYRRRVAFYSKDRDFDVSKMRNVLGYEPRYSNERGLTETADWYAEQGWL